MRSDIYWYYCFNHTQPTIDSTIFSGATARWLALTCLRQQMFCNRLMVKNDPLMCYRGWALLEFHTSLVWVCKIVRSIFPVTNQHTWVLQCWKLICTEFKGDRVASGGADSGILLWELRREITIRFGSFQRQHGSSWWGSQNKHFARSVGMVLS